MPVFEVEKDGRKFQVDAPDMHTAAGSVDKVPIDPMLPPAGSPAQELAKDIGRGLVRGAVRGVEAAPGFVPRLLGELGPYVNTPEEEAQREQLGKQIEAARTKAGSPAILGEPSRFVGKYVGPPTTKPGEYAQSVAEGAVTAGAQPGGLLSKAVTTIGGGVGAQAGRDVAGALGLEAYETPLSVVGGVLGGGGAGAGASATATHQARRLLPTSAANRASSKQAIDQMQQAGLTIDPAAVQAFAGDLRLSLDQRLFSPHPGGRGNVGFQAADHIERAGGDLPTILNVHSALGEVRPEEGANYAAAMHTREQIRDWVEQLPPTQVRGDPAFITDMWQHHRDTWRIHANLEEIDGALESAEWRRLASGRGNNLNTIRQEIRKIIDNDAKARRYSPEARAQMDRIVEGDLARNFLRRVAAFAPHGSVSSAPTLLATAFEGVGTGAAVATGTFLAHFLQGRLEEASLNRLTDIIREGSPLLTGPARRARSRLLAPSRARVGAGLGALQAGAGSSLAEQPEPVAEPGP